jgi:putative endonuclease
MHYVYILRSETQPDQTYTGMTARLQERVREHNEHEDKNAHTYKFRPWQLDAYVSCDNEHTASVVEEYFKNTSGKEKFANFIKDNPEHPHPHQGFFDTLMEGRAFGKGDNRFTVTKDKAQTVFVMVNMGSKLVMAENMS